MRGGERTRLAGSFAPMSNEPTRPRRLGVLDIVGVAALLVGIMFAVSLAIAVVVFLILILARLVFG
jgi:hypothetical protein